MSSPGSQDTDALAQYGLRNLRPMVDEMTSASAAVQPSGYWEFLNDLNLRQLEQSGFAQFKRTVNGNYFQWLPTGPRDPQFRAALRRWLRRPRSRPWEARLSDQEPFLDSRIGNPLSSARRRGGYALFVALLWEYARRYAGERAMATLEEPLLGDPLSVEYGGRRISQDLCNSAIEYASVTRAVRDRLASRERVVELGGGYGRLAWVFLTILPGCRYVMVDIPPALAVAEEYLAALFPDRSVFRFRRFDHFENVRSELEAADIAFLTPNQLEIVEPMRAGLFLNISSLHEMRMEQIEHYLAAVDTHCSGFFYTKQSVRAQNPYDGVVIRREDYPVPAHWKTVFDRPHPIQTRFFEALYRVGGKHDGGPRIGGRT